MAPGRSCFGGPGPPRTVTWLAAILVLLYAALTLPGPDSGPMLTRPGMNKKGFEYGKGRGWEAAQSLPERGFTPPWKEQVIPEPLGKGLEGFPGIEKIKKRSLRRAYKRLALHGFAIHRGQMVVKPTPQHPPSCPSHFTGHRQAPRRTRKRMTVFCWNAMTLTSASFTELVQWLALQRIDVALIQSTHWSIEEPWVAYGYSFIPSPELHKSGGGLLTLIRTEFCRLDALSYQDAHQGRLLHVRCHVHGHCIDVINVYQFPVGQTLTDAATPKK